MSKLNIIFLTIALGTLNACSSLSKEDCQKQNWKEFAQRYTESQGLDIRAIQQAAFRACSKYEVEADLESLASGHSVGKENYCQREKAWNVGLDGEEYNAKICPEKQQDKLSKVYQTANLLYQIEDYEDKASEARARITDLLSQVSNLHRTKAELLNENQSQAEVSMIDSKISALQVEINRETNQADQALMNAAKLRRRIQVFQSTNESNEKEIKALP